jgi:hypothetical protein
MPWIFREMNCANGQACENTWPFQLRVPFYLRHSKDVYELLTVDSGTCIRVSGPLGRENMSFTAWAFSFRDCLHCFQANIYYALSNTRWSFPPPPRPSAFAVSLHHSASHSGAVVWGTALQAGRSRVRFRMGSLEFFIGLIFPAALWSLGRVSL